MYIPQHRLPPQSCTVLLRIECNSTNNSSLASKIATAGDYLATSGSPNSWNTINNFACLPLRRIPHIPWTGTNKSILEQFRVKTKFRTIYYQRILGYFDHIVHQKSDILNRLIVMGKVEEKRPLSKTSSRT